MKNRLVYDLYNKETKESDSQLKLWELKKLKEQNDRKIQKYFPFHIQRKRLEQQNRYIEKRLDGSQPDEIISEIEFNPSKKPRFFRNLSLAFGFMLGFLPSVVNPYVQLLPKPEYEVDPPTQIVKENPLGKLEEIISFSLPRSKPYVHNLVKISIKEGVHPFYMAAIYETESEWNPYARGRSGEKGLGQLMPSTSKDMGVENPLNPDENMEGSSRYFAKLLKRYDGNLGYAVAAYNAGPTAANGWIRKGWSGNLYDVNKVGFSQTRNHIRKFLRNFQKLKSGSVNV